MNEVLRQEKKFLITLPQYYRFSRRLSMILREDSHNEDDGYLIRSLYFDTIDNKDYHEKEDGVELRRKIRLRNYGFDTPFAVLEMKQKQGSMQKKRSLRMDRKEAIQLSAGDYSVLLKYEEAFAAECFSLMHMLCYRPQTVVTYRRKAFVAQENKIRITFDHHITGSESCFDIFSGGLNESIFLDPYFVILEVKYNGFLLSYIKDMLAECDSSELSISKYCLGRPAAKHYRF